MNATVIELADVTGNPRVKMGLTSLFRIGDPLTLRFRLQRQNGTRTEALEVSGCFRVTAVSFDVTSGMSRQILSVTSTGVVPSWKAVKKVSTKVRQLPPTHFPRTVVA